jgi:hypothetical protein
MASTRSYCSGATRSGVPPPCGGRGTRAGIGLERP